MALKPVPLAQVNTAVNSANFNLNLADNEIVWHTGGCSVATIQMNSAVASATVTIQRSNDGRHWFALESAQTLGPLSDISDAIDVSGFLYLRIVAATTASGTAEFVALGSTENKISIQTNVTDGDKGDITVSGSGATWTIDAGVVTAAKTSITGTPSGSKYLRDDFSWQAVSVAATTLTKVMTADQSINSSTTLTNVTDLVFAIGANETWVYQFRILAWAELQTTGCKLHFTVPAGATVNFTAYPLHDDTSATYSVGVGGSTQHNGDPLDLIAGGFVAVKNTILIHADVTNGGTAGNVQLQFAQSTSDALNLTFKQGSFGVGNKV